MDIIVFSNDLYSLVPIKYNFDWTLMSVFEYCDAFREALATFNDKENKWIMNDGTGIFFGCIGGAEALQ